MFKNILNRFSTDEELTKISCKDEEEEENFGQMISD